MHRHRMRSSTSVGVVLTLVAMSPAWAGGYGDWGTPTNAELAIPGTSTELNTGYTDGCPILSPDGLRLYMASNRPGGLGGLDIWVAKRPAIGAPWRAPVALPAPVNSVADDFCPTPVKGGGLFFVSARAVVGACGGADIYVTRLRHGRWDEPANLGCQVNSAAAEAGPSLVVAGRGVMLYFSSTRPGGFREEAPGATNGDSDIYASHLTASGFGAAAPVPGLNSAGNDARPTVRHDGLEIFFDSDRPGTLGGPDIYTATRSRVSASWRAPVNLGPTVNTSSSESRASLSRDGTVLVFGSTRPGTEAGSNDIFVTVRDRR